MRLILSVSCVYGVIQEQHQTTGYCNYKLYGQTVSDGWGLTKLEIQPFDLSETRVVNLNILNTFHD